MFEYFNGKDYPGRGILIGLNDSGKDAVIAYFIMGRSANSRNRRFEIDYYPIVTRLAASEANGLCLFGETVD